MSYGTFFNKIGNVCLYNGAVVTGLQYPLINCSAALLSTVAGANWQTLANKIGITGENDTTHAIATSLALTSVTTGMLLKAGFAAIPGLQLASFTLGVSCKLIGWYLNNRETVATVQPPQAAPVASEEKRQEVELPKAKSPATLVLVDPLEKAVTASKVRSRSLLFTKQKAARAHKCALKERREQVSHLTRGIAR